MPDKPVDQATCPFPDLARRATLLGQLLGELRRYLTEAEAMLPDRAGELLRSELYQRLAWGFRLLSLRHGSHPAAVQDRQRFAALSERLAPGEQTGT